MNFPGLDPAWTAWHRLLHRTGRIAPWDLEQCDAAIAGGAGVVVVAGTALGDSILCTPLLQTLHDHLGRERVHFLVREPYLELYREDPRLAQAVGVRGKFRGLGEIKQALTGAAKPPKIALIANCSEPDMVPWLWRCGVRGFLRYRTRWSTWADWFANKPMMRRREDPDFATGHAIENNLAMAEAIGLKPTTDQLSIHVPPATGPNLPMDATMVRMIMVHPGASREIKRWSIDNWAHVIDALAAEFNTRVVLTGGPGERDLCARIHAATEADTQNLAGNLGLQGVAVLQQRAELFLSGDTGPYHLAVAVGCPTVTLFAPTDRGSSMEACGPHHADPKRHRALQTEHFNDSIETIDPEDVLAQARPILARS